MTKIEAQKIQYTSSGELKEPLKTNNSQSDNSIFEDYDTTENDSFEQYVQISSKPENTPATTANKPKVADIIKQDYTSKLQESIDERYNQIQQSNGQLTPESSELTEDQERWAKYVEMYGAKEDAASQKKAKLFSSMIPDSGNGKIDKPAKQISNNCWLIGGINSLAITETGEKLLENNLHKDNEKHMISVHLKEAENNHMPQPKGDGIYTFTEKEIFDAQKRGDKDGLVSGDGDVTAYALAIEEYLKEKNNGELPAGKSHFSDGAPVARLYEIVTGQSRSDANSGITFTQINEKNNSNETISKYFENIQNINQNKSGATSLNIYGHAFCVVGTDKDNLLIQESNLTEILKDKLELVPNSFPPTYKLPMDKFGSTVESFSNITWE